MAGAVRPRPQGPKLRSDPRPRPLDGSQGMADVWVPGEGGYVRVTDGTGLGRKFVLVGSKGTGVGDFGTDYYQSLGYEAEIWRKGGPCFEVNRANGEPIIPESKLGQPMVRFDHVLMSCSDERADEMYQYGPYGNTGQTKADEYEKNIIKRRSANDPIRGIHGIHLVTNEPRFWVQPETLEKVNGE